MFPRNLPTGFDKQSLRWIESLGTRRFYIFLSLYQWQVHWPPHSSWPGRCEAGTCASNWESPERERNNVIRGIILPIQCQQKRIVSHSFFAPGPMSGCCLCLFFSVTCVSVGECKIPRYSSRIKFSECWECRYLLRSGLLVSKISSNETLILPDWEAGDARNVTRRGGSLELCLRLRDPGAVRVCVAASGETWYLSQHYLTPALSVCISPLSLYLVPALSLQIALSCHLLVVYRLPLTCSCFLVASFI